jgi:hypothetical protein
MSSPGNRGFGSPEQQGTQQAGRTGSPGNQGSQGTTSGAAGVMGSIRDKASDVASSVASRAEDAWANTRHMAENVASSVADTAEDAWGSMVSCMRRYPLATFGAGIALGCLLTLALTSSRSSNEG